MWVDDVLEKEITGLNTKPRPQLNALALNAINASSTGARIDVYADEINVYSQ